MNWPVWTIVGTIVVLMLLAHYYVNSRKPANETGLPSWLIRGLYVGFVVFVIAIVIALVNNP
jgi:multisubunit Na+/H+ antiporter MnhB subunit